MAANPIPNIQWPFRRLGARVAHAAASAVRELGGAGVERDVARRRLAFARLKRERGAARVTAHGPKIRHRGHRIWQDAEGWRTSADPESLFDSQADAKAFVGSLRNPGGWGGLFEDGYYKVYRGRDLILAALPSEAARDEGVTDVEFMDEKYRHDNSTRLKAIRVLLETVKRTKGIPRRGDRANPHSIPSWYFDPEEAKQRVMGPFEARSLGDALIAKRSRDLKQVLAKAQRYADKRFATVAVFELGKAGYRSRIGLVEPAGYRHNPSSSPEHQAAAQVAAQQAKDLPLRSRDIIEVRHPSLPMRLLIRRHLGYKGMYVLKINPPVKKGKFQIVPSKCAWHMVPGWVEAFVEYDGWQPGD